jgi:hypothetical protein
MAFFPYRRRVGALGAFGVSRRAENEIINKSNAFAQVEV